MPYCATTECTPFCSTMDPFKLTVAKVRAQLKQRSLPTEGLKKVLQERLVESLASSSSSSSSSSPPFVQHSGTVHSLTRHVSSKTRNEFPPYPNMSNPGKEEALNVEPPPKKKRRRGNPNQTTGLIGVRKNGKSDKNV